MTNLLDTYKKDLLVYEDQPSVRQFFNKFLKAFFDVSYLVEDQPLSLSVDIVIHNPDVLLLDFMYEGGINLCDLSDTLKKYKGIIIIYTGFDEYFVLKELEKEIGYLPKNLYIVHKGETRLLKNLLEKKLKSPVETGP